MGDFGIVVEEKARSVLRYSLLLITVINYELIKKLVTALRWGGFYGR